MTRARSEAILERLVLRELGQLPYACLYRNEVGQGHPGSIGQMLERALSRYPSAVTIVRDLLNKHRIAWGLGVGSPDLIGCVAGRFVGIELKSEDGRIGGMQRQWREAAMRSGALVEVARTIEEAAGIVRRAKNEARRN